jgi:hypothetical protein
MKTILSVCLAVALCAPAFAQKARSQGNAPTVKQSLVMGDAKMSLDYSSISVGGGETMKTLGDKEKGVQAREMWNKMGPGAPLASFSTSIEVKCGDITLPAGEYQVYFTIGEDTVWSMNFKAGDKVHTTKLQLEASQHESKRLLLCLYAEEAAAGVYMSFGKMSGMISFTPTTKK